MILWRFVVIKLLGHMPSLSILDLCVIDMRIENHDAEIREKIREWSRKSHQAFDVSNCARRFWLGSAYDFREFPLDVPILEGQEAYQALLTYAAGIRKSGQDIDTHNRSKYRDIVEKRKKGSHNWFSRYRALLENIDSDIKAVDRAGLNEYKPTKPINTAFHLSEMQKGDPVLLMATLNKHGDISSRFRELLNLLTTHRRKHAGSVTIISVKKSEDPLFERYINELKAKHKMRADIELADSDNIADEMANASCLFSIVPETREPDINAQIFDLWKATAEHIPYVHLSDYAHDESMTTMMNRIAQPHYIGTTRVKQEHQKIKEHNDECIDKAMQKIVSIGQFRHEKALKDLLESQSKFDPQALVIA